MKFREYLNESLRGFKNKEDIGDQIESMDSSVEGKDRKKFDKILGSYIDKFSDDLTIVDCIKKLSDKKALALYDKLCDLYYTD